MKSKAGDNQAMTTMADTMQTDHKANQSALEGDSQSENYHLKSYEEQGR